MNNRRACVLGVVVSFAVLLSAGTSHATRGHLRISSSMTLMEDHYGSITITASGVNLDCGGKKIIFDSTLPNAFNCNDGVSTCGVSATNVSISSMPVTIQNCVITGPFEFGVWLKGTSFARVASVSSSAKYGFGLVIGDHTTLEYLTASGNTKNGFNLVMVKQAVWARVLTATGVKGTGFYAYKSEGVILSNSKFNDGWGNGITFSSSYGGEVHDNQVYRNVGWGMSFDNQQAALVSTNDVKSNEGEGMRFDHVTQFNIRNNISVYNDESEPSCDANQIGLNSSTWSGNTFNDGHVCGTVPTPH